MTSGGFSGRTPAALLPPSVTAKEPERSSRSDRRDLVFRLVAWASFLLMALGALSLALHWVHRWSQPRRNDFAVFYAAGRLALSGHLGSAYRLPVIYAEEAKLAGKPVGLAFPYPPSLGALLGLLARLPLHAAYDVFTVVNLLAFIGAALLAVRRLRGQWRLLGILGLVGAIPMVVSTAQGETGGVVALAVMLILEGFESPALLAPGIGLLSVKPELLLVPIVVVAFRRNRSELAWVGAGLAAAVLIGMTAGVAASIGYLGLIHQSMGWTTQFHWGAPYNYSLLAQIQALLGYGVVPRVLWAVCAGLIVVSVVARVSRNGAIHSLVLATPMALAANHLLFHDLTVLYPAATLAISGRLRWPALGLMVAPWLDPALYQATGVHPVVLACLAAVVTIVVGEYWRARAANRMNGLSSTRGEGSSWRSYGLLRWASASEYGTPSRSSGS